MTFDKILELIKQLARSQGSYGRLLHDIMELKENDSDSYEELKEHWEWMKFKDWMEFILYIEW